MARIAGVDVPQNKRVVIALTYIYGIGLTSAERICHVCGISELRRVNSLTDDELDRIRSYIRASFVTGSDLKKQVMMDIKAHIDLGSYRGSRHKRKLPVRGQNTHTNARTCKGKARVPVAGKKK